MGKITKGGITSGEDTRDRKEIFEFPVAKPPKNIMTIPRMQVTSPKSV